MSLATSSLSKNDQSVLLTILSGGEGAAIDHSNLQKKRKIIVDMEMQPDRHVDEVEDLVSQEKLAIKFIEENKDYQKAKEIFNSIISKEPKYASVYNNRAQLERIIVEGLKSEDDQLYDNIIKDLKEAILLAEPEEQSGEVIVSKMQATLLQSAYSQLGAVYIRMAESANNSNKKWYLEENASEALYCAGEYGSEIAKELASKVNPYAKLCGNMVQEALARERQTLSK